ncbi:MAG: RidA family protein [Actinomycetota bacterium]
MSDRRSVETDSFAHENPIPVATRIGPMLISGIIPAYDPGTRNLPTDLEAQVGNLFTHIGQALTNGGGTWDDVAKITFFTNAANARPLVNPFWVERFPDPDSRPSRHTQLIPNDAAPSISCEFIAWIADA